MPSCPFGRMWSRLVVVDLVFALPSSSIESSSPSCTHVVRSVPSCACMMLRGLSFSPWCAVVDVHSPAQARRERERGEAAKCGALQSCRTSSPSSPSGTVWCATMSRTQANQVAWRRRARARLGYAWWGNFIGDPQEKARRERCRKEGAPKRWSQLASQASDLDETRCKRQNLQRGAESQH